MTAAHSTNWNWPAWRGDEAVRRLTPDERGIWIDLLSLAAAGNPTGFVVDAQGRQIPLEEIARFTNCADLERLSKLINGIVEKGAASRDRTGRLFNRRMVRDASLSAKRSEAGKNGVKAKRNKRNPDLLKQSSPAELKHDDDPAPSFLGLSPKLDLGEGQGASTARARGRKRGEPLPADWKPSPSTIAYGRSLGMSDTSIAADVEDMRHWAEANAHREVARKSDWDATAKGWMRRRQREAPSRGSNGRHQPADRSVSAAADRVLDRLKSLDVIATHD